MGATAQWNLSCTVSGFAEGGTDVIATTWGSTNALGHWQTLVLTTLVGTATSVAVAASTGSPRTVVVVPTDSTNGSPFRLGRTTSTAAAVQCSSRAPSMLSLSTGATTFYLWSSAGTTAVTVRVGVV